MVAEIIDMNAFRKKKEGIAVVKEANAEKRPAKSDAEALADLMAVIENSRAVLTKTGLKEVMPILKIEPNKMKLMYEVVSSIDQINEKSQTYVDAENGLRDMSNDEIVQVINKVNPLFIKQKPIYFICAFRKILRSFGKER